MIENEFSIIRKDWTWLTSHLLLLLVAASLVLGFVYFVEGEISKRDASNDARWKTILSAQTQQTQAIQTQLTQDEIQWQQVQKQLLAQNSQLTQTIANISQQTQKEVQSDKSLDATQAAARLSQQTGATSGEVSVQNSNVVIDLPIARVIAGDLDTLVGTQAILSNTQKELSNETTLYTNAEAQVTEQNQLVAAQQVQLVDEQKACKAQVSAVKAAARKSKLKWFGVGYVLGFISGAVGAHAIGL